MASKQINSLTELTSVDTANDKVVIQDASAPTEAKYITPDNLVPDATTTMKGKSELATTAEVDTGTDTVRTVTPAAYNGSFATTVAAKIAAATSKTIPVGGDLIPILDSAASNVLKKLSWTDLLAALGTGLTISSVYPVGCIYTTTVSTNPNTIFGFGTWVAFGTGRCLVGFDSGQTEFDTVEETGGATTHTLTSGEMPVHTHIQNAHNHAATIDPGTDSSPPGNFRSDAGAGYTAYTQNTTAVNQNAGGGGAHNNLQPYQVVYFWKRVS